MAPCSGTACSIGRVEGEGSVGRPAVIARAASRSRSVPGGRWLGVALVVVSACAFGSGSLFAKPVYAAGMDWLTLMTWRFPLAVAASWLWILSRSDSRAALRRMRARHVAVLLGLGLVYVSNTATFYASLETVPASLSALIVYLYPPLVAVMSIRFGRRLQGRTAWLALIVATVGVALAVGGIDPSTAPPLAGLVLCVMSPILYAVWIVLAARFSGERRAADDTSDGDHARVTVPPHEGEAAPPEDRAGDPAPAMAIMMSATAIAYLVIGALAGRRVLDPTAVPADAWLGVLGVGVVSTAIAVQTFYAGIRRVGAAQASLISTVEPVWTVVLATLLLSETLTPIQLLGGAAVVGAVVLSQARPRPAPAPGPATA